jgi:hypothetical protein
MPRRKKRERFETFDEARKNAKAKAAELDKGTPHVANFTLEQTVTINSTLQRLRAAGAKLLPGMQKRRSAKDPWGPIAHRGRGEALCRVTPHFITYRMAVLKNAAEVSLEAGNTPKMVFEHYRELRTEAEGREWFSVVPAASGKIVAIS